jgi:hypothetical protein
MNTARIDDFASEMMSKFLIGSALGSRNPASLNRTSAQALEDYRMQQPPIVTWSILLGSPIWMPLWAAFHLGQRTWATNGRFMRGVAVIFFVGWVVGAVLVLGAPLLRNIDPAFFDSLKWYEGVIPVAIGALVLSFVLGRLFARFLPLQAADEAETPTWD